MSVIEHRPIGFMTIEEVDILDGTPLFDLEPFLTEFDHREPTRQGWLEPVRWRDVDADDRFHR